MTIFNSYFFTGWLLYGKWCAGFLSVHNYSVHEPWACQISDEVQNISISIV